MTTMTLSDVTSGAATRVLLPSTICACLFDALFDARVDDIVAEREHLRGKPAPDTYLAAARLLGVRPRGGRRVR